MRDTLIALVMFAVVAGGYIYLKRSGLVEPTVPSASAAKTAAKRKSQPSLHSKSTKGAKHDEESPRHDDNQQVAHHGQDEGASGDLAEAESLPSIYQDFERHESESRPAVKAESAPAPKRFVKKGNKKKVVHGVPVQAYLNSKKNSLALGDGTENSDLGMRVFVQCMELKKRGPEYVGPRNCEALLAAREGRPSGLSAQY